MKRLLVAAALMAISATACARSGGSNDGSNDGLPAVKVQPDDIVAIHRYIVPEGTQPPPFVKHARKAQNEIPLREVTRFIPLPLPAPSLDPTCGGFTALTISLRDGRELAYGACDYPSDFGSSFPDKIDAAYENYAASSSGG